MLLLIEKLITDFEFGEHCVLVQLIYGAQRFVRPRLLQINAFGWTVQRHLALFAAALRADTSVDRGAEALLFASFADRTTQSSSPSFHYVTQRGTDCLMEDAFQNRLCWIAKPAEKTRRVTNFACPNPIRSAFLRAAALANAYFVAVCGSSVEKPA